MISRRGPAVAALLLPLALVVGACSVDIPGLGGPEPEEPTSSGTSSGPRRTPPPNFVECTDEERGKANESAAVADVDLTDFSETAPTGFTTSSAYIEDYPVEGDSMLTAFVPTDQQHVLDALGIVVFPQMELGELSLACDAVSWADVEARVAQYHEIRDAVLVQPDERTTVAGLPAIKEHVELPEAGYTYEAYWIFGRGQVAHVWCQWAEDAETIRRGCDEYVAGLTFGDAG